MPYSGFYLAGETFRQFRGCIAVRNNILREFYIACIKKMQSTKCLYTDASDSQKLQLRNKPANIIICRGYCYGLEDGTRQWLLD